MAEARTAAAPRLQVGEMQTRPRASQEQVQQWWVELRSTGSEELRNYLLEHYLPLVKYSADRVYHKLPNEVELDDLMSAGVFGLMDAIKSFDLDRGIKFETYCAPRIRGAILDELRKMDWVPRLVRARSSKVEQARKSLEAQLGRVPTDEELCDSLDMSREEFEKIRKDVGAVGVVSLNRKCYETDSSKEVREADVLEDGRQINPLAAVQKRDLKEMVTKGLSRAERLILVLYYYEQMTMKEIGATLDLSESRVSQMHSSIINRLKSRLASKEEALDVSE